MSANINIELNEAHEEPKKLKKKKKKPLVLDDLDASSETPVVPAPAKHDEIVDEALGSPAEKKKKKKKKKPLVLDSLEDDPDSAIVFEEAAPAMSPTENELNGMFAQLDNTNDDVLPVNDGEKNANGVDDLMAALDEAPESKKKSKKKKKKKALVLDSLGDDHDSAVVFEEPAPIPAEDELGNMFSQFNVDGADNEALTRNHSAVNSNEVDDLLAELNDAPENKKKSKKKKKKKTLVLDEPDAAVDPILDSKNSTPPPVEETKPAVAPSSNAIDDIDDLLAELSSAPAEKKKAKKKKKKATAAASAGETAEDVGDSSAVQEDAPVATKPGDDVDDLLAELGGDAEGAEKTTAAAKKKAKKKKKKAAAKEGESSEPSATAKKPKKESAIVRRAREQQERMAAAAEAARKAQEEEERRLAEEERIRAEAEQKKAEARAKKKAADRARKERRRAEGTLLTKAEKERRRKAEQLKAQFRAQGLIPAAVDESSDAGDKKKAPYLQYQRKRKKKPTSGPSTSVEPESENMLAEPEKAPADELSKENVDGQEETMTKVNEDVPEAWDNAPDDWAEEDEETNGTKVGTVENDDNGASDDEVGDDDSSEDDSEYEGMSKAEVEAEKRREAIRQAHEKRREEAWKARTPDYLRSPIICIMGHVDTGKTKILDRIRRTNVQDGEAGGITQQIGATYFPIDAVKKETMKLDEGATLSYNVPSLLIIDTPGHESFTNLRSRGSSLCDIAILVIDIMHGIEPQTRESIQLLRQRKTPFIVALNKIDRIYDWNAQPDNCPARKSLSKQVKHSKAEFKRRVEETKLALTEEGFNSELYWNNDDFRRSISLVPTSAITGEGIPDLLMLLLSLPQKLLVERLMFNSILEATVLEVKAIAGLGTTIDIVLTGGEIHEGDTIMVVGLDGPITTTIRALLTPHPMKEMRVKGQYQRHTTIKAAQGVKISADGLEKAVAGTQIVVVKDPEDEDEMEYAREEVMQDFTTILTNVEKSGVGVYVQASTLGSLEALLEFLRTSKIPVSGINIGPVHKKDVVKASAMLERKAEYALILAFDVKVEQEAKELAEEMGVTIFTADIIYHLFDMFEKHVEEARRRRREESNDDVVFPSLCTILPQFVFNNKNPIILGVQINAGILRVGTPLVVKKGNEWFDIGRVADIHKANTQVKVAKKPDSVCVKIVNTKNENIMFGRHFTQADQLVSKISRRSIDLLKENFRDDLEKEDWMLVIKLKTMFGIQ